MKNNISLCPSCQCMTKTSKDHCGKCGDTKLTTEEKYQQIIGHIGGEAGVSGRMTLREKFLNWDGPLNQLARDMFDRNFDVIHENRQKLVDFISSLLSRLADEMVGSLPEEEKPITKGRIMAQDYERLEIQRAVFNHALSLTRTNQLKVKEKWGLKKGASVIQATVK